MVSTCIVPECKDSKRKRLAGVRYHRFRVSCPSLCRRWLKAANNPKYGVNTAMAALKNLRVCSLHFTPEDYERNVSDQTVKNLKECAVPSINLGGGEPGPPVKPVRTGLKPGPSCTAQTPPTRHRNKHRGTRLIPGMCSVLRCGSSRRGAQRFKLPEDPEKRLEWVQFVFEVNGQRLKESSWTDITICREHFTEDCFCRTKTGSVQLRSSAVPSLCGRSEPGDHVENPRSVATPTDNIPCSADAFAIITLSDEENVNDSDPSDEEDSGDEGGRKSDSEWNPLDVILLEEAFLQDSEEETEDEGEEDDDSLKINELCNECGCFFNSLKPHTCEHKIKPFSCNICGKRCVSEGALKIHSRVHSETYEIPCRYCHVTFKRKVDKLKHEQTHVDRNDPYKCPDCPKIFTTSKERRIHLSYHRTTREFKCGVCGFEFRDIHHLRRHSVVHTGLKPYKCSVCERGFNQASNLKSHMRVHTGEKPYKCPHCDKSFNHNVSLKSHVQRCHSSRSGHKHKMCKINEKLSSASDAEDNENKRGAGSESDNADKQDTGETGQKETTDLPKHCRRRTGRSRGRPKSNPDSNSVLSGQNEDQCSKTSKSKVKKLKKSVASDEESEWMQWDSDTSVDSEEEPEQKAERTTGTSRRRAKKDDDSDYHPEEENENKMCKSSGKRRGR